MQRLSSDATAAISRRLRYACCMGMLFLSASGQAVMGEESDGVLQESFYQELEVQRQPHFRMQGVEISQQIRYRILSSFNLYAADAAGRQTVVQHIREATLLAADPLSHAAFNDALTRLKDRQLRYRISASGEILQFSGYTNALRPVAVAAGDLSGMLVSNVIDEDGWKELAQLTLFQPPSDPKQKDPPDHPTRHDWGILGGWYGDTKYKQGKRSGKQVMFDFVRQLEYLPPDKLAEKAQPNTALEIRDAKFAASKSGGKIAFNTRNKRVTEAREWFVAEGTVTASLLGNEVVIQLHEQQLLILRVKADKFTLDRP